MNSVRGRLGVLAVGGALLLAAFSIAFEYYQTYRWELSHAWAMLQDTANNEVAHDLERVKSSLDDATAMQTLLDRLIRIPSYDAFAALVDGRGAILQGANTPHQAAAYLNENIQTLTHGAAETADHLYLPVWLRSDRAIVLGVDKGSIWMPLKMRLAYLALFVIVGLAVYIAILFAAFRSAVEVPLNRFLEGRLHADVQGLLSGTARTETEQPQHLDMLPREFANNLDRTLSLLHIAAQHKGNFETFVTVCTSEKDKHRLAENLYHVLKRELPVRGLSVFEINHSLNRLRAIYDSRNRDFADSFLGNPEGCFVYRSGSDLVQSREQQLSCCNEPPGEAEAVICKPLIAGGKEMGLCRIVIDLQALDRQYAALPTQAERLALARSIITPHTGLAALSLSNLSLLDSYKNQAITDALTGLYNRRYIMEYLIHMTRLARRGNKHLSVFVIDVDHFKRLNDEYGHTAGDSVLRVISNTMRRAVRDADIVARYGGEEFIVALPETDQETAMTVAERLRQAVADIQWDQEGMDGIPRVTVSVGVAAFPAHGYSHYHLINAADKAVYVAKNRGRNRSVLHNPLPDQEVVAEPAVPMA